MHTPERDVAGHCEACTKPIYDLDAYCPCTDGIMLCEEHAAKLSDVIRQYREILAVPNPYLPENIDTKEELAEVLTTLEADLEANGDRKILVTA